MKEYIEERALAIAGYIIEYNATVRQAAKHFGISKSTVHKDITERLEQINSGLAAQTRVVLDVNKSERHIRGGLATKEKYQSSSATVILITATRRKENSVSPRVMPIWRIRSPLFIMDRQVERIREGLLKMKLLTR